MYETNGIKTDSSIIPGISQKTCRIILLTRRFSIGPHFAAQGALYDLDRAVVYVAHSFGQGDTEESVLRDRDETWPDGVVYRYETKGIYLVNEVLVSAGLAQEGLKDD